MDQAKIAPSANVHPTAEMGPCAQVWHHAQVREHARIGARSVLGQGVYVDAGVVIGDDCKLQNYACTYHGVTLEAGVFVGPHACFTNDVYPRAINPDGSLKGASDWQISKTLVKHGATIGANATVRCGVTIGRWALVAAGSVVTRDVPDYGLVQGNPARLVGFVSPHGYPLAALRDPLEGETIVRMRCTKTFEIYDIALHDYHILVRESCARSRHP